MYVSDLFNAKNYLIILDKINYYLCTNLNYNSMIKNHIHIMEVMYGICYLNI